MLYGFWTVLFNYRIVYDIFVIEMLLIFWHSNSLGAYELTVNMIYVKLKHEFNKIQSKIVENSENKINFLNKNKSEFNSLWANLTFKKFTTV